MLECIHACVHRADTLIEALSGSSEDRAQPEAPAGRAAPVALPVRRNRAPGSQAPDHTAQRTSVRPDRILTTARWPGRPA